MTHHIVVKSEVRDLKKYGLKDTLCKVNRYKMKPIVCSTLLLKYESEIIPLPKDILLRIYKFMKLTCIRNSVLSKVKKFDCYCFMMYLCGETTLESPDGYLLIWKEQEYDEERLLPGDPIAMKEPNGRKWALHFAIYLGKGLYISKFGTKGKVGITSWKEMQRAYGNSLKLFKLTKSAS